MENRNIIKERKAVAGVIEALLLVALVSIIISTIQLVYIPQIMEQRESDHMQDVENQFAHLKSVIDIQCMIGEDVPITSPITLGSREIPYFVTAKAFGELSIVDDAGGISTDFGGGGTTNITLTSIKYQAYNSYFVDQTYVLEGGAVILKQHDGESMVIEPDIDISSPSSGKIDISCNLTYIVGVSGKNTTNGYKNRFIRTNYSCSGNAYTVTPISKHIRVYTEYVDSWYDFFNESSLGENAYVNKTSNYVQIQEKGSTGIGISIAKITIYAQIGPGWII
ncbi:MAG: hypothetical protein U9R21_01080 [Candidatus Thermoplasmatota archaeon]|nr:hypothetical protein [Candidatus Thermoplasmatota archaeon]